MQSLLLLGVTNRDELTGEAGQSAAWFYLWEMLLLTHTKCPWPLVAWVHIPCCNAYAAHTHCDMRKCIPLPYTSDLALGSVCSGGISGHAVSLLWNTVHIRWVMIASFQILFNSLIILPFDADLLWNLVSLITTSRYLYLVSPSTKLSLLMFWGTAVHHPATLILAFHPSYYLPAWRRLVSCSANFHPSF